MFQNEAGTNVRIQSPNTAVLRQGSPQLAGKQLILQKPLTQGVSGQIVTLVKTSQGISVQSKPGSTTTGTILQQGTSPKTPTIVKLVPNALTGGMHSIKFDIIDHCLHFFF